MNRTRTIVTVVVITLVVTLAVQRGWKLLSAPGEAPTTASTLVKDETSPATAHDGWQTYSDTAHGFSLRYPAATPVDIAATAVDLPEAVGGKERKLKIDRITAVNETLDADGCLAGATLPSTKKRLQYGPITGCLTVLDEGAAGSTYRTYHYTAPRTDIDLTFIIRYPTSVRVYAGCENDADQATQKCIDLAFDEVRDTALFTEIVGTLRPL